MTSILSSPARSAGMVGVFLATFLLLSPQNARGQLWLQTSSVITPVEQGPVRVFLDSLISTMERRELKVRRSPDSNAKMTVSELRTKLINEKGIGLSSANHAFIDYRFSIDDGSGFQQQLGGIHFVYRPGPNQSDIPVFYLNTLEEPWLDQFLRNKGTTLHSNQAALIPFHRHLGFAQIARQEETQVVEIGGQTVRQGFHEEKQNLIRKVERLTYESYV